LVLLSSVVSQTFHAFHVWLQRPFTAPSEKEEHQFVREEGIIPRENFADG
jgi:hypothetical protein